MFYLINIFFLEPPLLAWRPPASPWQSVPLPSQGTVCVCGGAGLGPATAGTPTWSTTGEQGCGLCLKPEGPQDQQTPGSLVPSPASSLLSPSRLWPPWACSCVLGSSSALHRTAAAPVRKQGSAGSSRVFCRGNIFGQLGACRTLAPGPGPEAMTTSKGRGCF